MKLKATSKAHRAKCVALFREAIVDIDSAIDKVHSTRVDFAQGSVHQRVITELDGARVSARAAIHQLEQIDGIKTQTSKPALDPNRRLRDRKAPAQRPHPSHQEEEENDF